MASACSDECSCCADIAMVWSTEVVFLTQWGMMKSKYSPLYSLEDGRERLNDKETITT